MYYGINNILQITMSHALRIHGGIPLQGTVKVSGAKNAMTKLLVASLISDKPCTFFNVPDVLDVRATVEMCQECGAEVIWDKQAKILEIQTRQLKTTYVPERFSGSNRIPILMIGALLARSDQEIIVPVHSSERTSSHPVDFHLDALRSLGATIEFKERKKEGAFYAFAPQGLKGCDIQLPYPSVGATENTILAAAAARGVTTIQNAAIEPEVVDLVLFLQKLGVIITLDVDRTIKVQGTRAFHAAEHTLLFDRHEAACFAMAAVATNGRILVEGAEHHHMLSFLNTLREVGGNFSILDQGIEFFKERDLKSGLHIETDVHPGFMTDWQPPFTVLLTQAKGASVVHETVFEHRFGYIETLQEMGADIAPFRQCLGGKSCRFAHVHFPHSVVVKGMTPLKGRPIHIPDLRASFAYLLAALIAEGESTLHNIEFLERNHENLLEKLRRIQAQVTRVPATSKRQGADLDLFSTNEAQLP